MEVERVVWLSAAQPASAKSAGVASHFLDLEASAKRPGVGEESHLEGSSRAAPSLSILRLNG